MKHVYLGIPRWQGSGREKGKPLGSTGSPSSHFEGPAKAQGYLQKCWTSRGSLPKAFAGMSAACSNTRPNPTVAAIADSGDGDKPDGTQRRGDKSGIRPLQPQRSGKTDESHQPGVGMTTSGRRRLRPGRPLSRSPGGAGTLGTFVAPTQFLSPGSIGPSSLTPTSDLHAVYRGRNTTGAPRIGLAPWRAHSDALYPKNGIPLAVAGRHLRHKAAVVADVIVSITISAGCDGPRRRRNPDC